MPAISLRPIGLWLHDWIDQDRFRTVTLWVLLLAGANMIRRGLMAL